MATTPSRMLTLLSLLQTRRDWPGALLAERLGVSDRTVRRDVERLRELGYRVLAVKGPDGGYRLDAGAELPPLLFDDEQAIAIALALRTAAATGVAEPEAALRALTTVRQVMPARLRHRLDALGVAAVADGRRAAADPAVLVAVNAAVHAREVLRFDHLAVDADPTAEPRRRRVEPHRIVFAGGRWYLVAWDLEVGDWRVFRLDRMSPRIPTGPRFTRRAIPGDDAAAFVAARFAGREPGEPEVIAGSAVLACAARDLAPYLPAGAAEPIDDVRCRVRLASWSWTALAAEFARLDADIVRFESPELADAAAHLSRRLTAAVV